MNWLDYSPIGKEVKVIWVKNKNEFVNWIEEEGLPNGICFDHDLGKDEPTGYDCARWLIEYCLNHKILPPLWACQSANPVGKVNINRLLRNFMIKFQSEFS